jgi:hypothetical protein
MNMIDYIFDDIIDKKSINFTLKCKFKIIDYIDGYYLLITNINKKDVNHMNEIDIIKRDNPINISNVTGVELENFVIDKIYPGEFIIDFYEDNSYDMFFVQII